MQPPLELTLIVAATRNMGIGAQGTMPWKGLRKEMQYFARVTTRVPPHVSLMVLIYQEAQRRILLVNPWEYIK